MLVFLSWSGLRSRAAAVSLHAWLAEVLQVAKPWMSTDIEKGKRWTEDLSDRLERSRVGILCLTEENLASPWLHFEAGALAKTRDARVINLLIGLSPASVGFPLAQFQDSSTSKEDIKGLLQSINHAAIQGGEEGLHDAVLERVFNENWPRLEASLRLIEASSYGDELPQPLEGLAKMIMAFLSEAPPNGLTIEELTPKVIAAISRPNRPTLEPGLLTLFATELEGKYLPALLQAAYIEDVEGRYRLTATGHEIGAQARQHLDELRLGLESAAKSSGRAKSPLA